MKNFFTELPGFHRFSDLSQDSHYVQAPEDWTIVITDVVGSTKAIEQGRYKIVNMVGASSIAAIVNAVGTRHIPFVFGGDGATALIPNHAVEQVKAALWHSRQISQAEHGLDMRIGLVPHRDLLAKGFAVRVAKYILTKDNALAFFKGKALDQAEKWVKAGEYLLPAEQQTEFLDPHKGLSCRWAPLTSARGFFLTILIKIDDSSKNPDELAFDLLSKLDQILEMESPSAHPVKAGKLKTASALAAAGAETSFQTEGNRFVNYLKTLFFIFFVKALNRHLLKLKSFDMDAYKESLPSHSDYRKFDETLRMVVDCTPAMKLNVEKLLEDYHRKGLLSYGLHQSPTALMTCFVQDYRDQHMHFVDGGDGGYAMAARGLKDQLKKKIKAGI